MIYHITTTGDWQAAQQSGVYIAPSLAKEGFIHCSTRAQVVTVANAFYRDVPDLILLHINEEKLARPLKWEAPAHPSSSAVGLPANDDLFPHLYDPLNLDAVVKVIQLEQRPDGNYVLSDETP